MKKAIGLALILALGIQFFSKIGIITFYHFYKSYVIETYCENADQPLLACEGSCFLKKGLEKDHDHSSNSAQGVKQIEMPTFLISSPLVVPVLFTGLSPLYAKTQPVYFYQYRFSLFQPPKGI